uniref:Uncharacterized protein n=1 Tax=Rangifer tarandus platyrhynchus TaxID=3082113 RepID=A0ACB0F929_RANTA|nr:unnamed protein product [Rangifer tarandus platyrhynchus]
MAQEWPRGATPRPRRGGCMGPGGPRGATPRSGSGGAAVRRYSSFKESAARLPLDFLDYQMKETKDKVFFKEKSYNKTAANQEALV